MKNSSTRYLHYLSITVLLLLGCFAASQLHLNGLNDNIFPRAQAQEPSEEVPDVFNQGRFVKDTKTGAEIPPGELDAWSGPWKGSLKITSITADGVEKTNAQVISEMEAHYLNKKKLRQEAEAARAEDPGSLAEIPGAIGDAIGEALEDTMDLVFISIFDMAGQGVPIGFSLRKLDQGYRLYISGTPAKSEKDLDDVPLLKAEGRNTLHARKEDMENNAVYDINIVSNPNKTALDTIISIKASNIKESDKSSLYDSVDIVIVGKFDKGEYTYEQFQESLLVPMMMTMEKYNNKLNPEEEEQE